jgi:hypothetical protein
MESIKRILTYFVILAAATLTIASPPPSSSSPSLKAEAAVYKMEYGVLDFSFTFTNPTDSVLFLDCQVPPKFKLAGKTLSLTLDRKPAATPDSSASQGFEAFPPQRVGAHQTFQGQRRFDRIPGATDARPDFSALELRMAVYPERGEGEGDPFVVEKETILIAKPAAVTRRGKKAPPPTKTRIHPLDP